MATIKVKPGDKIVIYRAGGRDTCWHHKMNKLIGQVFTVSLVDKDNVKTIEGWFLPLACLRHYKKGNKS